MTISSIYGASSGNQQNVTPAILSSTIDSNGNLVLVYANGAVVNVGRVVGSSGANGAKGDKGDRGDKGDKGDTGAQGPKGDQGAPGIGLPGAQGPAGIKGDRGPKGDTGPQGPIGLPGVQGVKGDTGTSFNIKNAGPYTEFQTFRAAETQAHLYSEGTTFLVTSWDVTDNDLIGIVDMAGAPIQRASSYLYIKESDAIGAWSTPIQFQGVRGPQGPVGPVGPQGPVGPKGAIGDAGPVGPSGYYVSAITLLNNQLVFRMSDGSTVYEIDMIQFKGDTGPQGAPGKAGQKGDKGEAFKIDAKITIDNITLTAEQEIAPSPTYALAQPSGFCAYYDGFVWYKTNTAEVSTLNNRSLWSPAYKIQGEKGDKGVQGVKGDMGPQGFKGDRGRAFGVDAQGTQRPSVAGLEDGFTFYNTDNGTVSIYNAASGNWRDPVSWRGPQGPQGVTGIAGPQGLKGDKGDSFKIDAWVDLISKRAQYNSKNSGFVLYSEDIGKVYFKLVSGSPAGYTEAQLWSDGYQWRGPEGLKGEKGDVGPQGDQGTRGFDYQVSEIIVKPLAQAGTILSSAPYSTYPAGYAVLIGEAGTTPQLFIKMTASTWSAGSPFGVGPQGPKGATGPKGAKGDAFTINEIINSSPQVGQAVPGINSTGYKAKPIGYNVYDEFTGNLYIKKSDINITPLAWDVILIKGPKGDKGDSVKFSDLTEQEKAQLKGPAGPQGPAGPASVLRGNWSPYEAYAQGDMVYYNDSIFQALTDIPKNFPAPTETSAIWAFVYTRVPAVPLDSTSSDYAFVAKQGKYDWMKRSDFMSSGTPVPAEFKRFTLTARHSASNGTVTGTSFNLGDTVTSITVAWVVDEFETDKEAISSINVSNSLTGESYTIPSSAFSKGVYVLQGQWKKPVGGNFLPFVVTFKTNTGKTVVYQAVIQYTLPGGSKMWSGFLANETITPTTLTTLKGSIQNGVNGSVYIDRTNTGAGKEGVAAYAWVAYTIDRADSEMPNVLKYSGFPFMYKAGVVIAEGIAYQLYRSTRKTGINTITLDKQG